MGEIHLGCINYELVGKPVSWRHTSMPASFFSHILTEDPFGCQLCDLEGLGRLLRTFRSVFCGCWRGRGLLVVVFLDPFQRREF